MGDSVAAGPDLFLDARDVVPDMLLASGLGIGGIGGLPTEVVRMIRDHSSSSLFWRYSAVLDLTRALRAAPSDALSVPLARVRMWERGRHPEIEEAPGRPQAVRLTIDSYGIRRIEALAGSPSYQQRRTDQLAFVILEADKIQGVTAHFKVRCFCLSPPLPALLAKKGSGKQNLAPFSH